METALNLPPSTVIQLSVSNGDITNLIKQEYEVKLHAQRLLLQDKIDSIRKQMKPLEETLMDSIEELFIKKHGPTLDTFLSSYRTLSKCGADSWAINFSKVLKHEREFNRDLFFYSYWVRDGNAYGTNKNRSYITTNKFYAHIKFYNKKLLESEDDNTSYSYDIDQLFDQIIITLPPSVMKQVQVLIEMDKEFISYAIQRNDIDAQLKDSSKMEEKVRAAMTQSLLKESPELLMNVQKVLESLPMPKMLEG